MDSMKFKNISYLEEIDKYQVRLVINGKDFQPTYNTLRKAIINRNKFYLQYAVSLQICLSIRLKRMNW
ncbi:hypothetical protein D0C17_13325 [Vibrio cholerae]|nr:hypothetical protein [Vibrio cholerae]